MTDSFRPLAGRKLFLDVGDHAVMRRRFRPLTGCKLFHEKKQRMGLWCGFSSPDGV